MGDQRIDTAADAATSSDADPGEGTGLAAPSAHEGGAGDSGDMVTPEDERGSTDASSVDAERGSTEGERSILAAEANREDTAAT